MAVTIFAVITALLMLAHVSLGGYVLWKCSTSKKISYNALILPMFLLLLGLLLDLSAVCLYSATLSRRVIHLGFASTAAAILFFTAGYCDIKMPKYLSAVLVVLSIAFPVFVWTNEYHMLFYSSVSFRMDAMLPVFDRTFGPIGIANRLFVLFCLLGAMGTVIYKYGKSGEKERKRLVWLAASILLIIVAVVIHAFTHLLYVPIFAIAAFVFISAVNIIKYDMFDISAFDQSGIDAFTRQVLDESPMMIEIWSEDRQLLWCNKKELGVFGFESVNEYDKSRVWPKFQENGVTSDDKGAKVFEDMFEKNIASIRGEWTHLAPDGSEIPVEFTTVLFEHDKRRFMVSYQHDMREIRAAQEAEKSAYMLMEAVMNSAPVMISVWDRQFNLVHIGQNSADFFGATIEDIETRFLDFVPEYQRDGLPSAERYLHDMESAFRTGSLNTEVLFRKADGTFIDSEVIGRTVTINDEEMLIMCVRDIGYKKAAEQRESMMYDRIRAVWDSVPMSVVVFDAKRRAIDCNEEAVRVFTTTTTTTTTTTEKNQTLEAFDKYLLSILRAVQPGGISADERVKWLFDTVESEGKMLRLEWDMYTLDGEDLPVETTFVRIDYQDTFMFVAYIRDLRDARKAQEEIMRSKVAEESNKAKSQFLANMSHEIRTPMNVIVGFTELLMDSEPGDVNSPEYLKKINTACQSLAELVSDVLDISQIEAQKLILKPIQYDFASLLNDIMMLCTARTDSRLISFEFKPEGELPTTLYGDDTRLKQVVNNILSNAFKYTRKGVISLSVSSERAEDDFLLRFSVSDTGIGIRREDLNELFKDYSQVDTRANRAIEGTGLGLAIAKGIAESMGGSISVQSKYGKGSVFTIEVRQGFVSDEMIAPEAIESLKNFRYESSKYEHGRTKFIDLSRAKVLVVDDSPTNLDVAKGILSKYKMSVDCVLSGREAVDKIEIGQPVYDAIFMDHMMPGMDGVETLQHIRNLGTDYAVSLPIIAMTANVIAGNEQMFLDYGFQAYIPKPIRISRLDAVIRRWIVPPEHAEATRSALKTQSPPEEGDSDEIKQQVAEIPGINMKLGLSLYEGDMELLKDTMLSYTQNIPTELNRMRAVSKESLEEYAIDIHTIKGASSSIGAKALTEGAKEIEKMAKSGDLEGVLEVNERFIEDVETLIDDIKAWLG